MLSISATLQVPLMNLTARAFRDGCRVSPPAIPLPNARNKAGDVRAMHALGTRVQNGDHSTVPYATNDSVHCRTLRDMVVA